MLLVSVSNPYYIEDAVCFVVGGDDVEIAVLLWLEFIDAEYAGEVQKRDDIREQQLSSDSLFPTVNARIAAGCVKRANEFFFEGRVRNIVEDICIKRFVHRALG